MNKHLKELLDIAQTWPEEDHEVMTPDERAAVEEGLRQAERGEFVPDEEIEAFWKRHGVG